MGLEQETWGSCASPLHDSSLCFGLGWVQGLRVCRCASELALHFPQCAHVFTQWQWQSPPWLGLKLGPERLEPHFWYDSAFSLVCMCTHERVMAISFSGEQCWNRRDWIRSPVQAEGLGGCWGCPGKLARAPGSFQSAESTLGLGTSKSVCTVFQSGISVSFSFLVSPTGFQTN